MTTHNNSWITESVVQFSYSPMWRNPVNNFVDDHCFMFEDDTEMKLEYTTIHNEFKKLVDSLLTGFVNELGISLEMTMSAIQESIANPKFSESKATKRFLKYIFAADDFRSFHKMMLRRNIELDILATSELAKQGIAIGPPPTLPDTDEMRDDWAYEANGDFTEEEAIQMAIFASIQDSDEKIDMKLALEDAVLQENLAMHIQKEKLKALHSIEVMDKEVKQIASKDIHAAKQYQAQKLSAINETKEMNIRQLEQKTLQARSQNVERNLEAQQEQKEMSVQSIGSKPIAANCASPSKKTAEMKGTGQTPAEAPHLKPGPRFGLSALPPIAQQPSLNQLKSEAEAKAATAPKKKASVTPATAPQPTKEEMEARAKYMKEQRQKILAQTKAARQQELNDYAKKNAIPITANTDPQAETKKLTVDIAKRLREDIIQQSKK